MSALGSALDSIQQASALLDRTASRLAKPISVTSGDGGDVVDLSTEILALLEARTTAAIGVKLAQAVDDLQKSSLDVLG